MEDQAGAARRRRLTPRPEYGARYSGFSDKHGGRPKLAVAELEKVAAYIAKYTLEIGLPPSVLDVAHEFHIAGSTAHNRMLGALDAGYLRAVPRGRGHRLVPTRSAFALVGM